MLPISRILKLKCFLRRKRTNIVLMVKLNEQNKAKNIIDISCQQKKKERTRMISFGELVKSKLGKFSRQD
jgi:hypothetical protein